MAEKTLKCTLLIGCAVRIHSSLRCLLDVADCILIPCTKIECIYDASDKCLVVKKALGRCAKQVHFIYSEKFRNHPLPDSQNFVEKVPVYEELVQYLQGQWIKKHPQTSGLKKGWNGTTSTEITEENQRNQYYKKISFRIADNNFPVLYTINSYGKIAKPHVQARNGHI